MLIGEMIFYSVIFVLLLLSGTFLSIGIVSTKKYNDKKERCALKTKAKVITMHRSVLNKHPGEIGTYSWYPEYEYFANGHKIKKMSKFGQDKRIFNDGDEIDLYYNPNDCEEYYVPAEKRYKLNNIMIFVGSILAVVLIVAMICFYMFF